MMATAAMRELFPGFDHRFVEVGDGVRIATALGGEGPPVLLLHGHPQTRAMWHRVARVLARRYTVVVADLRGYGDSSRPAGLADHANYAKRAMAHDQVIMMRKLGFERFHMVGHDRGARVAYRLAMDHPGVVHRLVLLEAAPTLTMYEQTTEAFARNCWHWFFLIQPAPLPERLIEADSTAYCHHQLGRRGAGLRTFDARALAEYERCIAMPGTAHAMCEDFRASAGIDLFHDRTDRDADHLLAHPVLVLWGQQGLIHRCFHPLDAWGYLARDVSGGALACGHHMAEEAPEELLARILPFLGGEAV